MTFDIVVVETIAVEKLYTVEADNLAEAEEKALRGETVSEVKLRTPGVINRALSL